jgi:hypothetical protein
VVPSTTLFGANKQHAQLFRPALYIYAFPSVPQYNLLLRPFIFVLEPCNTTFTTNLITSLTLIVSIDCHFLTFCQILDTLSAVRYTPHLTLLTQVAYSFTWPLDLTFTTVRINLRTTLAFHAFVSIRHGPRRDTHLFVLTSSNRDLSNGVRKNGEGGSREAAIRTPSVLRRDGFRRSTTVQIAGVTGEIGRIGSRNSPPAGKSSSNAPSTLETRELCSQTSVVDSWARFNTTTPLELQKIKNAKRGVVFWTIVETFDDRRGARVDLTIREKN